MEKTHSRQSSMSSDASPPHSFQATSSPLHPRHRRNDSAVSLPGGSRRTRQTAAARAAAQRLARAMASTGSPENSSAEEDDLDDDLSSVHSCETSTPRRSSIRSSISQTSFESTTPRRRTTSQPSMDLPSSRHRTPSLAMGRYLNEQTGAIRPTPAGRSAISGRPSTLPPTRQTLRPTASSSASDLPALPATSRIEKGMSFDLGNLVVKEEITTSLDLQDEIDVLEEQNDNILRKLREAEERCEAAESKANQLEKKVSFLGDRTYNGIHTLSRKETMFRQREANEGETCVPKSNPVKSELRLRKMARRMILCQEEKEEVMLKRCWLARYWKLCKQYGIYADIAEEKYEYWSSVVSDPLETMLSTGQKAREDTLEDGVDIELEKHRESLDMDEIKDTEENLLNMILVEKGMRELASLKIEDAVLISLSQNRISRMKNLTDDLLQAEGQNPGFVFDLSEEEKEDVQFKKAWLAYYWRRAKNHGLEEDIAEERLQFWIEQENHSPSSQDALEVERGLHELKKLGIESLLWEATREGIELVDSLAWSED